jgi:Protein of unknown function (DUF2842)
VPIRLRKLVGAIALLALVVGWTIIAITLPHALFSLESPLASMIYYAAAGLGWVLPAMPLISWMSRRAQIPRDRTKS